MNPVNKRVFLVGINFLSNIVLIFFQFVANDLRCHEIFLSDMKLDNTKYKYGKYR